MTPGETVLKHDCFQITQKVFIRDGNRLLVMRDRKSGYGDLPGGRMTEREFFSDWMHSVARELQEELGSLVQLDIRAQPIFIHRHRVNDENFPCLIIAYEANFKSGNLVISEEHDYMEWVDIQEFKAEELFSEHMLDAVNYYLNKYCRAHGIEKNNFFG